MLNVVTVTKRFGSLEALRGVSLQVGRGEFFGLLGPNGAGKSTLMSLLSGFRAPDTGTLSWDGEPLAPQSPATRRLGLVPQSLALYEDLTAWENLRFFGRLHGLGTREVNERAGQLLETVTLTDRARDPVKAFSGGMKRRLNLAASLMHRPSLLLCDEPTVGVDPQSRLAIFELLQRLNREGLTIVYTTHYMEEAQRLCPRLAIIDHGRILAAGGQAELLATLAGRTELRFPRTPATAAFVDTWRQAGGPPPEETNDHYRLFPPEGFRLSRFLAAAEEAGLPGHLFQFTTPTLEDLFIQLTGRTLRE